jgi:hypothetical protein
MKKSNILDSKSIDYVAWNTEPDEFIIRMKSGDELVYTPSNCEECFEEFIKHPDPDSLLKEYRKIYHQLRR